MSTTETNEMAEIQFSVLKRGSKDPQGPYNESELLNLLNNNELGIEDLVYFDGIGEWKPINEVFEIQEQISHFVDDGQDTRRTAN